MPRTLASLPKGHSFPPTAFDLSPGWVRDYTEAVEDSAIARLAGDLVPPMAVAALSIRALLDSAALPAGAIHLGQELAFQRPVRAGERLLVDARVSSRGERQGWVLMGVDLSARGADGTTAMTGRATLTFPINSDD